MDGTPNNRRESRFFTGNKSELQKIKNQESLQKFARRKYVRKRFLRIVGMLAFAILALIFIFICFSVFFRVREIEVVGSSRYSADEILALSDVELGDELYGIGKKNFAGVYDKLAYIKSIKISRKLPSTLVIGVTTDEPYYVCNIYGEDFLLSSDLRVLEQAGSESLTRLLLPEIDRAVVGSPISFDDKVDERYIKAYLKVLDESTLAVRATGFDLRDKFSLALICDSIYLLEFGDGSDLATKMSVAEQVLRNSKFDLKTPAKLDLRNPAEVPVRISPNLVISFD